MSMKWKMVLGILAVAVIVGFLLRQEIIRIAVDLIFVNDGDNTFEAFDQEFTIESNHYTFETFDQEFTIESNHCYSQSLFVDFSDAELEKIKAQSANPSLFEMPAEVSFIDSTTWPYPFHDFHGELARGDVDEGYEGYYSIKVADGYADVTVEEECGSTENPGYVQWTYKSDLVFPRFSKLRVDAKDVEGVLNFRADLIPYDAIDDVQNHIFSQTFAFGYHDFGAYPFSFVAGDTVAFVDFYPENTSVEPNWSKVGAIIITMTGYGKIKLDSFTLIK